MMFSLNGFEVPDPGVDVPADTLMAKAGEFNPDIIGISGLLTLAFVPMKRFVDKSTESGVRNEYKVIIGGAQVDQRELGICGGGWFRRRHRSRPQRM